MEGAWSASAWSHLFDSIKADVEDNYKAEVELQKQLDGILQQSPTRHPSPTPKLKAFTIRDKLDIGDERCDRIAESFTRKFEYPQHSYQVLEPAPSLHPSADYTLAKIQSEAMALVHRELSSVQQSVKETISTQWRHKVTELEYVLREKFTEVQTLYENNDYLLLEIGNKVIELKREIKSDLHKYNEHLSKIVTTLKALFQQEAEKLYNITSDSRKQLQTTAGQLELNQKRVEQQAHKEARTVRDEMQELVHVVKHTVEVRLEKMDEQILQVAHKKAGMALAQQSMEAQLHQTTNTRIDKLENEIDRVTNLLFKITESHHREHIKNMDDFKSMVNDQVGSILATVAATPNPSPIFNYKPPPPTSGTSPSEMRDLKSCTETLSAQNTILQNDVNRIKESLKDLSNQNSAVEVNVKKMMSEIMSSVSNDKNKGDKPTISLQPLTVSPVDEKVKQQVALLQGMLEETQNQVSAVRHLTSELQESSSNQEQKIADIEQKQQQSTTTLTTPATTTTVTTPQISKEQITREFKTQISAEIEVLQNRLERRLDQVEKTVSEVQTTTTSNTSSSSTGGGGSTTTGTPGFSDATREYINMKTKNVGETLKVMIEDKVAEMEDLISRVSSGKTTIADAPTATAGSSTTTGGGESEVIGALREQIMKMKLQLTNFVGEGDITMEDLSSDIGMLSEQNQGFKTQIRHLNERLVDVEKQLGIA